MRIPRIYTTQSLSENSSITLDQAAAHYVVNVLRMKEGRPLILFNGEGGEYEGTLATTSKKTATVNLFKFNEVIVESPIETVLGVCLIKNDRMDWLLQKATEMGVTKICPLLSEFTDVKFHQDRADKKMQHWNQVVINACQQSGRTSVPVIDKPIKLESWASKVSGDQKLVLHPYQSKKLKDIVADDLNVNSVALLVGPEGGLSEGEVKVAHQYGFQSLSMGPRILRAETAPLAALCLVQQVFGDL
jgi:16S rRNA (uracil1498-N3)-methyltransferase